ncbi:MAG: hypothetical protein QM636_18165 [Rhizobium sp.]
MSKARNDKTDGIGCAAGRNPVEQACRVLSGQIKTSVSHGAKPARHDRPRRESLTSGSRQLASARLFNSYQFVENARHSAPMPVLAEGIAP